MATRTDPTFVDPTGDISPGERLRTAREAADLSVKDIATALRLEPRTIAALESGSFDELPAPTFVRGYLRSYARVVGLAPDPLLDLYERHGFTPPAISPDPVEKSQAHTSDLVFRLATFAIGAALLVLVVLWWNSQDLGVPGIDGDLLDWSSDTTQDSSPPDPGQAAAPTDGDEADSSTSFLSDLFSEPDETATATPADTTPVRQEPVAGDGPVPADTNAAAALPETGASAPPGQALLAPAGPGTASVGDAGTGAELETGGETGGTTVTVSTTGADASPEPGRSAEAEPVTETAGAAETDAAGAADAGAGTESTADTAATAESETDTESGAVAMAVPAGETRIAEVTGAAGPGGESASASAPPPGESELVLDFAHESWVEVYDRDRTRLFFGLVSPGRVLEFTAPAPFDVLLGFALDTRITLDGRAFDHTPFINHGVARFRLEPTGDGVSGASTQERTRPSDPPSQTDEARGP